MTSLAQRRAYDLRLDIARAAQRIFLEQGDTAATVESICEAAGVSPRTFYRHFPVKEDVVAPIFQSWYATMKTALNEFEPGFDVVEDLAQLYLTHQWRRSEAHRFMRILDSAPGYRLRWASVDTAFKTTLAETLVRCGLAEPGFDAELAAELLVHACVVAYSTWLRGEGTDEELELLLRKALTAAASHWTARVEGRNPH